MAPNMIMIGGLNVLINGVTFIWYGLTSTSTAVLVREAALASACACILFTCGMMCGVALKRVWLLFAFWCGQLLDIVLYTFILACLVFDVFRMRALICDRNETILVVFCLMHAQFIRFKISSMESCRKYYIAMPLPQPPIQMGPINTVDIQVTVEHRAASPPPPPYSVQ